MNKNIRWRVLLILAVIGVSIWAFYPPEQKVKLGLDLKGGVHLVLLVQTDDALKAETNLTIDHLKEELDKANVRYTAIVPNEPKVATEFRVDGVQDDAVFREKATEAADASFSRSSGAGGTYTFTMRANVASQLAEDAVTQAIQTIERRVNELGVAEPIVTRYSGVNQILVQLPGVEDVQRAKELISSTAQLEFRLVEQGPFLSREAATEAVGTLPPDSEILPGRTEGDNGAAGGSGFYVVKKSAVVTGANLRSATQGLDQYSRPAVDFTLKQDAAVRFGTFTSSNVGRPLGIILDKKVMSAPTLRDRITDRGQITGITREEMQDLIITLKSGALPATLTYLEERTVGASLGQDSIRAGIWASVGGLALVVLFMIVYYKLTGLNAVISIVVNLMILLGLMAYLRATMTLPGIAGFILTIGMGVDSNVLIFERIKEELATGRTARAAVNAGFDRVWMTIVDTHVSSLIAALLLLQFGTGPIRGFAVTLIIGLLSNVFTAVFVSRTAFELVLSRHQPQQAISI